MGTVLALALAAAVYPQLLAVVVVILTRPGARHLLWGCYAGALAMSVGCGVAVYAVFNSRGSLAGTSSSRLGASTYLVVGVSGLLLAALIATEWGRVLLAGDLPRRSRRRGEQRDAVEAEGAPVAGRMPATVQRVTGSGARVKSKAEQALRRGSLPVAVAVGAVLGIPGPFDVLAIGHMVRAGYGTIGVVVLLVAFNLVKFVLIEVPIASYAISPERTAARVDRFAAWMRVNKVNVIAGVVAVISLALIVRGMTRLG